MKARTLNPLFAALLGMAILFSSCSQSTAPEPEAPSKENPSQLPDGYPAIPKPSDPLDLDQPMTSDTLAVIVPIDGKPVDFAPVWSAGTFTWDTDIQTQAYACFTTCEWNGETPGDYWNGARHSSAMRFEGNTVDLRNPAAVYRGADVIARQILFVEQGLKLAIPRNPGATTGYFDWMPPNQQGGSYTRRTIKPCLFVGTWQLQVDPGFLEKERRRTYYVAATGCPMLTTPVYVKRERFWERLLLDGKKSVRLDPGTTLAVEYTKTEGTSSSESTTIAHTLNAQLGGSATGQLITGSLGYSLSHTFQTTVEVTEEESSSVTRTITGMDGKTVIYSMWGSVERYTIVDANGNPYTDPNFTFSDLGTTAIRGEYEWLQSTSFPYQ